MSLSYHFPFLIQGGTSKEGVVQKNDKGDVVGLSLNFTICPGMSEKYHGGRENNKHSVMVDPNIFYAVSAGIYFNTAAKLSNVGTIKNKTHLASGKWHGVYLTKSDGGKTIIRRYYLNDDTSHTLPTYKLYLVVQNDSRKVITKDLSHHRWNNILASNLGLDDISQEGLAFLGDHVTWEAKYLRTANSQVDKEDKERLQAIKTNYGLKENVNYNELPKVEDGIPQGQCDVDHCLHRYHWISNSIYHCYSMSHTANTLNVHVRRGEGDWCYLNSDHKYTNGK